MTAVGSALFLNRHSLFAEFLLATDQGAEAAEGTVERLTWALDYVASNCFTLSVCPLLAFHFCPFGGGNLACCTHSSHLCPACLFSVCFCLFFHVQAHMLCLSLANLGSQLSFAWMRLRLTLLSGSCLDVRSFSIASQLAIFLLTCELT